MEVWKVGKTFLIHRSSSMLWEMIVSNVTCMKIEYIRLKHAKWVVWSFKAKSLVRRLLGRIGFGGLLHDVLLTLTL
ncbi:hypothetical protein LDENG_00238020 [Lucifuga dentata]|nr:hypothetical protein LDENG_00238020 [Lucifuga dentata]